MIFSRLKTSYLLLLIITFGLLLRVNNLTIGFPGLFLSNDEAILHQSALNMLANKTPFTIGNYGPLGSYTQIPFLGLSYFVMWSTGVVEGVGDLEKLLLTQEGYLLFIPRVISAMFGVLTILIIYKLSLLLFEDQRAALWSAFFTAVSFNLVHISHQARTWSPAIFFVLLTAFLAIKTLYTGKGSLIIFSYISAAISFGFHPGHWGGLWQG